MSDKISFGKFVATKRIEAKVSLRSLAEDLKFSAPFWSDVEKDRRTPPAYDKLETISVILHLDEEDRKTMFELAGEHKKKLPEELAQYFYQNDMIAACMRKAMDKPDDVWKKFYEQLDDEEDAPDEL